MKGEITNCEIRCIHDFIQTTENRIYTITDFKFNEPLKGELKSYSPIQCRVCMQFGYIFITTEQIVTYLHNGEQKVINYKIGLPPNIKDLPLWKRTILHLQKLLNDFRHFLSQWKT